MTLKQILRPFNWKCCVISNYGFQNSKLFAPLACYPSVVNIRHKGHSKWQNIKADKAKGDALKHMFINKITRKIWQALREGPPDPKVNSSLQKIFTEGMRGQIPFDTLNRITQDAAKKPMTSCYIDVKGPGESCFVIAATGKDRRTILSSLDYRTKRVPGGFKFNDSSVKPYFAHLGIIWVLKNSSPSDAAEEDKEAKKASKASQEQQSTTPKPLTLDDAETLAIEVNAESVSEIVDDNNEEAFEIVCDPMHVARIEKELSGKNYVVTKAESEFRPVARVKLTEQHRQYVDQFYEALDLVEEIDNIYDNLEQSSE